MLITSSFPALTSPFSFPVSCVSMVSLAVFQHSSPFMHGGHSSPTMLATGASNQAIPLVSHVPDLQSYPAASRPQPRAHRFPYGPIDISVPPPVYKPHDEEPLPDYTSRPPPPPAYTSTNERNPQAQNTDTEAANNPPPQPQPRPNATHLRARRTTPLTRLERVGIYASFLLPLTAWYLSCQYLLWSSPSPSSSSPPRHPYAKTPQGAGAHDDNPAPPFCRRPAILIVTLYGGVPLAALALNFLVTLYVLGAKGPGGRREFRGLVPIYLLALLGMEGALAAGWAIPCLGRD